jgi:hypothetical protein
VASLPPKNVIIAKGPGNPRAPWRQGMNTGASAMWCAGRARVGPLLARCHLEPADDTAPPRAGPVGNVKESAS